MSALHWTAHVSGIVLATAFSMAVPVSAAPETVRGQLIDKACYERNPANTEDKHVDRPLDECAMTCAKYGLPLAVLTADGKLYQVTGDLAKNRNQQLLPHVLRAVEITGEVTTDEDGALLIAATTVGAARP